jgi:ATP-binding cassette subfamily G (WHITE) protein 2 (SNQ2)
VSGERFAELSFAYNQSHLWRVSNSIFKLSTSNRTYHLQNFGICLAYGILFASILLIFTELNTGTAGQTSVITFKRGTSPSVVQDSASDEDDEKALQNNHGTVASEKSRPEVELESAKPLAEQQTMTVNFSWQNIKYVVPVSGGEHRQLLDDVSGYVSPGKLTALMGESGAGKVHHVLFDIRVYKFLTSLPF